MKYLVLVGDGMGDRPVPELGGLTPLEKAVKPNMDYIARNGLCGTAMPTPAAMTPESDTANLALLGYDPLVYSKGRSPLEAMSIGVDMKDDDTAIRCNIVTLSDGDMPYEDRVILDHSSGEIDTPSARTLIEAVDKELGGDGRTFYCGMSYRHCLIWNKCPTPPVFTRPHDILGKRIGDYLPKDKAFRKLMVKSFDILDNHPVNVARRAQGKNPANSVWFWANGAKPMLPPFAERYSMKGCVVAAVDLLKGIAKCAGMDVIKVEGADGTADTNYMGKAQAGADALDNYDFVFIHVEAPDECGHRGEPESKVRSIEKIDAMLGLILSETERKKLDCRILLCCDHPTPLDIRTHSHDSVPFVIYDTTKKVKGIPAYTEKLAVTGFDVPLGYKLINTLLQKEYV